MARRSPPAAPRPPATSRPTSARSATRSTPASRRSSTPAAASPASRPATPRRPPGREGREQVALLQRRPPAPRVVGAVVVLARVQPAVASHRGGTVFEAVEGLVAEHAELEGRLAAPETHADQRLAKRLNQRYAELSRDRRPPGATGASSATTSRRPASSRARTPPSPTRPRRCRAPREQAEERLRHLLVPRDPTDAKDALLEVKSGEGGEESALFAGDLLRMYTRFAEAARLEDRGPRRHRVRPRRLQVGHRRGQGQGHARARARRRTPCSSSRAACTGCSGCRSPSRRAACTPAPPASW